MCMLIVHNVVNKYFYYIELVGANLDMTRQPSSLETNKRFYQKEKITLIQRLFVLGMIFTKRARNLRRSQPFHECVTVSRK